MLACENLKMFIVELQFAYILVNVLACRKQVKI